MLLEAVSWLDRWLFAACLWLTANSSEERKCHRLFLMGTRTVMMMAKTTLVVWVNYLLKRRVAVFSKNSSNLMYEHKMERRDAPIFCSIELLPSSWVLCVEAIQKAVVQEKARTF